MVSRPEREVSLARFIPFKVRGLDGDEALCDDEIKLGVEEVSEDAFRKSTNQCTGSKPNTKDGAGKRCMNKGAGTIGVFWVCRFH
ncbi:hypothetical protein LCGC14_2740320, partial [marine sediment metagenome]